MYKIAVDGMGGDFYPQAACNGVMLALEKYNDIEITVFGDKEKMAPYLKDHPRLKIVHTEQFLDMGEKDPFSALRTRLTNASMFMAMRAVANKECDAIVSSGPTQALVVGGTFIIKRIDKMRKIGIAPFIPSVNETPTILLDSGANVELKPENLESFAVFASVVSKVLHKVEQPKVGLLNIGTEEGKGRQLDVDTFELLKNNKEINFIGNIEPKDILDTEANVLVSDGFTANIAMKAMEGTAKSLGKLLKDELTSNIFKKIIVGLFLRGSLKRFKQTLDPSAIGGAMLAGLKNIVVKAHGSSDDQAICSAIRQTRSLLEADVIGKVTEILEKNE